MFPKSEQQNLKIYRKEQNDNNTFMHVCKREYMYSGEQPPNWCNLVQDLSEQVTDEQYDMARTWYSGEVNDKYEVYDEALVGQGEPRNLREQAENLEPDLDYSKPTARKDFTDLATVGLRHSSIKLRSPTLLKESDQTDTVSKEITKHRENYGLLIVTTDVKFIFIKKTVAAYHKFLEGYDYYLDLNFDGTCNSMSILGQIYLGSKIKNKNYTLKEMMQQPDKVQFEKGNV